MKPHRVSVALFVIFVLSVCPHSRAQFNDSSSGLLSMPSADMNPSGTVMITNNILNKNTLTEWYWGYSTFAYGINITFFSRLEVGYVCVLLDGRRNPNPINQSHAIMFNQDRHFTAKVQLLREEDFGIKWMPAFSVGVSDPVSAAGRKGWTDYTEFNVGGNGNGFFNRVYAVCTKHFDTSVGRIGAHLGYQYNIRTDFPMNGPCAAIDWIPKWVNSSTCSLKAILEYDSRTINTGVIASFFNNHFQAMLELINFRWLAGGIRYQFVLKT